MNHDWTPFEAEDSETQVAALLELLTPAPMRVLELGCGSGRVLAPLAEAGHQVTGLDRDPEAIAVCERRVDGDAAVHRADFHQTWPVTDAAFDAVVCVGNTMMTVVEVDDAITLLRRVDRALAPGGLFIMDDCPHRYWPELAEGNWRSGLSDDGEHQLVWSEDDAVFTWRRGSRVDPDDWSIGEGDRRYRLWTTSLLDLVAASAGLSAAHRQTRGGLLIMRTRRS